MGKRSKRKPKPKRSWKTKKKKRGIPISPIPCKKIPVKSIPLKNGEDFTRRHRQARESMRHKHRKDVLY